MVGTTVWREAPTFGSNDQAALVNHALNRLAQDAGEDVRIMRLASASRLSQRLQHAAIIERVVKPLSLARSVNTYPQIWSFCGITGTACMQTDVDAQRTTMQKDGGI